MKSECNCVWCQEARRLAPFVSDLEGYERDRERLRRRNQETLAKAAERKAAYDA